jgi:hypothetical protein
MLCGEQWLNEQQDDEILHARKKLRASALMIGEISRPLLIVPPSSVARASRRVTIGRLLKYRPLAPGRRYRSVVFAKVSRSSICMKLVIRRTTKERTVRDSSIVLIPDELLQILH